MKASPNIDRYTLQEIADAELPTPERLIIVTNGSYVTVISTFGAVDVEFPVYALEDRSLRIEEKDIEWTGEGDDRKPSIPSDLRFAVVDEPAPLT